MDPDHMPALSGGRHVATSVDRILICNDGLAKAYTIIVDWSINLYEDPFTQNCEVYGP
jgi:hypothetical protein